MKIVVCWCCEFFSARFNDSKNKERITDGKCKFHNKECMPHNNVCEDFLLMQGLFTTRSIPEYCKNYKEKTNKTRTHTFKFPQVKVTHYLKLKHKRQTII